MSALPEGRIGQAVFFSLCLALVFLLFVFSFPLWHSLSQKEPFVETFLESYQSAIQNEDVCFSSSAIAHWQNFKGSFEAFVNSKKLISKQVFIAAGESKSFTECLEGSAFHSGDNTVTLSLLDQNVFFHVFKGDERRTVTFQQTQPPEVGMTSNLVLLFIFAFSFFSLLFLFTVRMGLLRGTLFAASFLVIVSQTSIVLRYLNLGASTSLFYTLYLSLFLAALVFAYKSKAIALSNDPRFEIKALASCIILLLSLVLLQLFLQSHLWPWNVFYEGQTRIFLSSSGFPDWNPLSYLGRPLTFAQGYSLFESTIGILSGLPLNVLFSASLFFANVLLILSVIFFGKTLGFSFKKSLLFLLFILSLSFIFNTFVVSPRHSLSFALALYALALLLEKKQSIHWVFPGLVLAAAFFIQIPMIAFSLILFFLFYSGEPKSLLKKRYLAGFGTGISLFLLMYSPTLLRFGMPLTSKAQQWGYMVSVSLHWFLNENSFLLPVLIVILILGLVLFASLEARGKKLFLGLIATIILQFLVTFRFNLVVQVIFGALAIMLLFDLVPKKFSSLSTKKAQAFLGATLFLLCALALWQNFSTEQSMLFSKADLAPYKFIQERTNPNANFLPDPLYGHPLAFLGNRKVLADLYVEYADSKKLDAAYSFLLERESSVIEDYGIDFVFVNKEGISIDVKSFLPFKKKEITFLDKVYSNGSFEIYHRP